MYRKREASVEVVSGGTPKKTARNPYYSKKNHLESTAARVEKMKKAVIKRKPQDPGTLLDGGIILD